MASQFELECEQYLQRFKQASIEAEKKTNHKTNEDNAKSSKKNLLKLKNSRKAHYKSNGTAKVDGSDIVSNPQIDNVAIKTYSTIHKPPKNKSYNYEHFFLIHEKSGFYYPSKTFRVAGAGGRISFDCFIGQKIDWNTVVAVGHTHPFYKGEHTTNIANRNFSGGDPTIVLAKQVPLFLRAPESTKIKVLEVKGNWLKIRKVSLTKTHKSYKWTQGN